MIIRPVSCNFHQLFRNDPQDITLRKVSFSTSHLVMTLQVQFCKQYQQASYFHQSFRNKRKTRHHQAADFHRFFRIARKVSRKRCSCYCQTSGYSLLWWLHHPWLRLYDPVQTGSQEETVAAWGKSSQGEKAAEPWSKTKREEYKAR